MKKTLGILLAAFLLLVLAACGSPAQQGQEQEQPQGQEEGTQMANPVVGVADASAFDSLDIYLEVPADATTASYSVISDQIAQIDFSSASGEYVFRASKELSEEELHGIYEVFDADELNLSADGDGWETTIRVRSIAGGEGGTLATWSLDGISYTLWNSGATDVLSLGDLATMLAGQMHTGLTQ